MRLGPIHPTRATRVPCEHIKRGHCLCAASITKLGQHQPQETLNKRSAVYVPMPLRLMVRVAWYAWPKARWAGKQAIHAFQNITVRHVYTHAHKSVLLDDDRAFAFKQAREPCGVRLTYVKRIVHVTPF
jgi:hypothetical protein